MAAASSPLLAADDPKRVVVALGAGGEKVFKLDGEEVVLMGGNYVFKTQPYFPPREVVSANAKQMSDGARSMSYTPPPAADGSPRSVKACVRLGCMLEGAMPNKAGSVDPTWAANLDATIEAFAEQGVYVFLEVHMDAFSTTNGGDGFPWWIGDYMQSNIKSDSASGHCCCFGSPSYIVNPENPMTLVFPSWLACCCCIRGVQTEGNNPWAAYAIGTGLGNPAAMNVGNLSVRLNNNDSAWQAGTLTWITQVHNYAARFYQSASTSDREAIFEPYCQHIRYLCRKWEQHWNVVAVELLNEPVLGGLPSLRQYFTNRRNLFDLYAGVLEELGQSEPPIRTPLALQDGFGSLARASCLMKLLSCIPISSKAQQQLREWGEKCQLILSIHWYPGLGCLSHNTTILPKAFIAMAKEESRDLMASSPLWLSEFYLPSVSEGLAFFANAGLPAMTYWQYVDTEYTQTGGWFKYPPSVTQYGEPITTDGTVNAEAWAAYEKTVADGSYWGGMVCGGANGQNDVLSKVK
ncbi:unnamed protein product [Symbiodinium natans]|uniref:Glycoside hydrolase family 5 domain-containing protein n=1 Tax=Symbiodinium natans TaxID=878477 RepID=A0A812PBW1_9DINO|nr:unnamed protein product [Symbiodinium natans]